MTVALQAKKRDNLLKSVTKEIRKAGDVPAILYGNEVEPQTISVNNIELVKTVREEGRNAIISLQVDNDHLDVMLHDYQTEPLKGELIHADFYAVNMSEEMDVNVPISVEGEAKGVKEGGVLQQPLYELQVRAKPRDIPEQITVNVTDLEIGDSILASDLKDGKKYEVLEDETATIVSVLVPDEQPSAEEAAGETEDAEPEVINEKSDS
ncbi:50S ribosomal protein L25 [Gracilibacillus halophilus YIM-C55.5]|uniref:Large ribosomal subunit protein bL25 n=1 Tax=Gracilibacillus halophilus YIM-C55.5 TaxID=1308866 RepID=N4WX36_9BACI|nr:50S ribosomal protein L25/general stress protein Ctc [Gracilibacillus halophilus]ENH97621.1 50S ribosomal protein L25 [Gracilibacillus halophilus YIM-C55.5]